MLVSIRDFEYDIARQTKPDIIVASSGYERRGRFISKKIFKSGASEDALKLFVSLRDNNKCEEHQRNDRFFRNAQYNKIGIEQFSRFNFDDIFRAKIEKLSDPANIVFDYSSMPRRMYSEAIQYFNIVSEQCDKRIIVDFVYSVGQYGESLQTKIVKDYVLLTGYGGVGSQAKSKHCIYSLGFEGILVGSLHEWLEPYSQEYILADPGASTKSADKCRLINRNFVTRNPGDEFSFPLDCVSDLVWFLADKAKRKSKTHDVIYVSVGPKPFTLAGLLAGLGNRKLANIYAVGKESKEVDVTPNGRVITTRVVFSSKNKIEL